MQQIQQGGRIYKDIAVEQRTGIAESVAFIRVYCRQQIAAADRFRKSLDALEMEECIVFHTDKVFEQPWIDKDQRQDQCGGQVLSAMCCAPFHPKYHPGSHSRK